MTSTLFPEGISHYISGGLMIGLAIGLLFLITGQTGGVSTFFSSTWSFLTREPGFRATRLLQSRNWRLIYSLGLILGGTLYVALGGDVVTTSLNPLILLLGGFLIGFGSRMGNGCTAGHGICGLALLQLPSLIAVVTFLGTAIIVAHLIEAFTK